MLRSLLSAPARLGVARAFSATPVRAAPTDARPSKDEVDELFKDEKQPHQQEHRRHAYSFNRVELLGGVAEDPTKRVAKNGRDYVIMNVFTNSTTTSAGGMSFENTERHPVTVFGNLADFVCKRVKKSTRVLVHGRIHYSGNELLSDGTRTPRHTHIHADSVLPIARNDEQ